MKATEILVKEHMLILQGLNNLSLAKEKLENLASYISLLRRHIYNEDHVFFKMAEKELTDDENKALLVQFKVEELKFKDLDFLESSRKLVKEIEALIGA